MPEIIEPQCLGLLLRKRRCVLPDAAVPQFLDFTKQFEILAGEQHASYKAVGQLLLDQCG